MPYIKKRTPVQVRFSLVLAQTCLPGAEGGQGALDQEAVAQGPVADYLRERGQETEIRVDGLKGLGIGLRDVAQERPQHRRGWRGARGLVPGQADRIDPGQETRGRRFQVALTPVSWPAMNTPGSPRNWSVSSSSNGARMNVFRWMEP